MGDLDNYSIEVYVDGELVEETATELTIEFLPY
jgi:hypothetical protein